MEQYVDWFGFMTYDLHGFWDANNPTLGNIMRPQTDIRDIQTDTLPLQRRSILVWHITVEASLYLIVAVCAQAANSPDQVSPELAQSSLVSCPHEVCE